MTPRLNLDDAGKEIVDDTTMCNCTHMLMAHGDEDELPCHEVGCDCRRFSEAIQDFDDEWEEDA